MENKKEINPTLRSHLMRLEKMVGGMSEAEKKDKNTVKMVEMMLLFGIIDSVKSETEGKS